MYRDLEGWAAALLGRQLRTYELKIAELCATNSVTPSPEDDGVLVETLTQYIKESVREITSEISTFVGEAIYRPTGTWSELEQTGKHLASELSVTVRLAGEIARLELMESGYEPTDRASFSRTRIERFCSQFCVIPHPFDITKKLGLSPDEVTRAARLLAYVVFHAVNERRLSGFETKFVSAFSRYLTCPRDSSASAVDQIAALFEPFLKKLAFLFNVCDETNKPIWSKGLDGLVSGLNLTSANTKCLDETYWRSRGVEDAVFRVAYQLRHKGAHEAHDYPYYERERNAFFVFAAILLSCRILMDSKADVAQALAHQGYVETMRELFVKVDELNAGPDGPRFVRESPTVTTRFGKLLAFGSRAQAIWPTCSATLADGLQGEYMAVKYELAEADREADLESYMEDMRSDEY